MEISAIMLLIGVALLIGLYLYDPFTRRTATGVSQDEQDLSALLAEQERILSALNELDMDYELGKIPQADYPLQREGLVKSGVDILRRLDALKAETSAVPAEDRLQKAAAAQRQKSADASDDDLEALIARRRAQRKQKTSGFCPQCGHSVLKSDKFCPHCGHRLK